MIKDTIFKRLIIFLLTSIMLFGFMTTQAFANTIEYNDIVITAADLEGEDAAQVIESYLKQAKENASDTLVYRIFVPQGEYLLNSELHIYSNTELYLDENTTLLRTFEEKKNMIKLGDREITQGYDGYRNIVISGGVWCSGYTGTSCAMRFGHCTNVTVSNLTISNIKNNHHIEFAGADNFNVIGCTFTGTIRENTNSSCEALQIDILHDENHFPAYESFDDTPCKNITVKDCNFTDLYAGIGTRSAVVGSYFDNINIINNTFTNIQEKAITCLNYTNSNISGNTITNATSGIIFEHFPISNSADKLYFPNDEATTPVVKSSINSAICNNSISVNKLMNGVDSCAITVYGRIAQGSDAENANAVSGSYLATDMNISGNVISCLSSISRGIFLTGVKDSVISYNTVSSSSSAVDGINAINLCDSSVNTLQSNSIIGGFNNGISLYTGSATGMGSKSNAFYSNGINGVKSYGIRIATGSTGTIKFNNQFANCGISNIRTGAKNASQDMGFVKIKSIKASGRGKAVLRWNSIANVDGYKIYRSLTPNGNYRQIATVKGNDKQIFEDKSTRVGMTYYYKIAPYSNENGAVVIGFCGAEGYVVL